MGLMTTLLLSCRKASALLERKRSGHLSPADGIRLRMHLGICRFCKTYSMQSATLDRLLAQRGPTLPTLTSEPLEAVILQRLDEIRSGGDGAVK